MCARLNGGAGGEWNCQSCGMVGCWPTKHQCFRCGTPRYARNGGAVGGKPRGPPREQKASTPTPTTGEPTFRTPRRGTPQNRGTAPSVPAPSLDGQGGGMTLLSLLLCKRLDCRAVMSQVESKLVPPRPKDVFGPRRPSSTGRFSIT